ncbi:unnamed protein product, partial [Prorocentrum cordatum]
EEEKDQEEEEGEAEGEGPRASGRQRAKARPRGRLSPPAEEEPLGRAALQEAPPLWASESTAPSAGGGGPPGAGAGRRGAESSGGGRRRRRRTRRRRRKERRRIESRTPHAQARAARKSRGCRLGNSQASVAAPEQWSAWAAPLKKAARGNYLRSLPIAPAAPLRPPSPRSLSEARGPPTLVPGRQLRRKGGAARCGAREEEEEEEEKEEEEELTSGQLQTRGKGQPFEQGRQSRTLNLPSWGSLLNFSEKILSAACGVTSWPVDVAAFGRENHVVNRDGDRRTWPRCAHC